MSPEHRHATIIAALAAQDSVEVQDLSESLGVSSATIRRDLIALEARGVLQRTHGGAVRTNFAYELPLRYRETRQELEKDALAAAVANYVSENMRVGLSGGTTLTRIGRTLGLGPPISVLTNSLSVASELAQRPQHTLVTTGGLVRNRSYEMVGPVADRTIAGFNLDLCIIGADGVSESGVSTHDHAEAATNCAMVEAAGRCIVAVDHTKLGKTMFSRICGLEDVHLLLTTGAPPADLAETLDRHGVELVLADPPAEVQSAAV